MRSIKDHKQGYLFDHWSHLGPRRRRLLDDSWAGLFRQKVLSELPVYQFAAFFASDFGRPTKELYTVLGVHLLQQTFDLTDEETIFQLAFNIQWHYALNIPEESDEVKYMCLKTLWNMRHILIENSLEDSLFSSISKKLAKVFNVDLDNQRIDSTHIRSNMRKLGRITLFASGINKFLKNLKRHHTDSFVTIASELIDRYLPEKSLQCFSRVKPSDSKKTLDMVSNDLFDLVQQFKDHPQISKMYSYKQLERILGEQCNISLSNDQAIVELKKPKEIPSNSLQNPSDPDATYDGHKGQGYQVQIMETYHKNEERKPPPLNLITHVEVEPACHSDADALIPAIESTQARDLGSKEVLGDSLYGSDENQQEVGELGVEVVAPVMGRPKEGLDLSDFEIDKNGDITACPAGHKPIKVKKNKNRYSAAFNIEICSSCPNRESCPVKPGEKYNYLRFSEKDLRIAQRRSYEKTEEFIDRYRWRSGIEATMSEYDRRTGVKRLRVRGFKAVKFCATLKATGVNILRAAAVRKSEIKLNVAKSYNNVPILVFKVLFYQLLEYLRRFSSNSIKNYVYGCDFAN